MHFLRAQKAGAAAEEKEKVTPLRPAGRDFVGHALLLTVLVTGSQFLNRLALRFVPVSWNSGISFGIGHDVSAPLLLIVILGFVFFAPRRQGMTVANALIIAGGLSNIIDRLVYGAVLDWIHVFGLWFNVADVMIVGGAVAAMCTMVL